MRDPLLELAQDNFDDPLTVLEMRFLAEVILAILGYNLAVDFKGFGQQNVLLDNMMAYGWIETYEINDESVVSAHTYKGNNLRITNLGKTLMQFKSRGLYLL